MTTMNIERHMPIGHCLKLYHVEIKSPTVIILNKHTTLSSMDQNYTAKLPSLSQ